MVWLPLLSLMACDPSGSDADAPVWYGEVDEVVNASCANCHAEGGIGTFPLDTYEAAYVVRNQVQDAVVDGRMPSWMEGCLPGWQPGTAMTTAATSA